MITYKQLSLADIFQDCQNKFDNDKYQFLELLEQTIKILDAMLPPAFLLRKKEPPLAPIKPKKAPAAMTNAYVTIKTAAIFH